MRIIAGKYRGRRLKSPPSLRTRPTSDRLRETLFNIIAPRIEGARFLDLCAGSGAVGIEALSRGAAQVTFVDRSRKMGALIKANLDSLSVAESETDVVCSETREFLRRAKRRAEHQPWDIIFFDPPYSADYTPVLELMGAVIAPSGLLVCEHYHKKGLSEDVSSLHRVRMLKQGDSCLSFYEAGSSDVFSAQRV
jgi:16S rRNA (guanine966-N2)-methyltransferase